MIEQQIRTWDIFDGKILDLYDKIKRENYVPNEYKKLAFTDVQLPLKHDQFMLAPKQEARVLQALKLKSTELNEIIAETEKEEKALMADSLKAEKVIEERLLTAYKRIRSKVVNGLAVVSVEREACGGCFSQIPPQRQLDIQMHKRVIVCEHCGRVMVDANIFESQEA